MASLHGREHLDSPSESSASSPSASSLDLTQERYRERGPADGTWWKPDAAYYQAVEEALAAIPEETESKVRSRRWSKYAGILGADVHSDGSDRRRRLTSAASELVAAERDIDDRNAKMALLNAKSRELPGAAVHALSGAMEAIEGGARERYDKAVMRAQDEVYNDRKIEKTEERLHKASNRVMEAYKTRNEKQNSFFKIGLRRAEEELKRAERKYNKLLDKRDTLWESRDRAIEFLRGKTFDDGRSEAAYQFVTDKSGEWPSFGPQGGTPNDIESQLSGSLAHLDLGKGASGWQRGYEEGMNYLEEIRRQNREADQQMREALQKKDKGKRRD